MKSNDLHCCSNLKSICVCGVPTRYHLGTHLTTSILVRNLLIGRLKWYNNNRIYFISGCYSVCLMCFFNRDNTEGTNSLKFLSLMFVYVLFYVNLCQDWFCGFGIICGLMTCAEQIGDRLNIVFSRDVILCGWFGSKYQLTLIAFIFYPPFKLKKIGMYEACLGLSGRPKRV